MAHNTFDKNMKKHTKGKNENRKAVEVELSEGMLLAVFNRFVMTQVICTLCGAGFNTILHGISPVIVLSFMSVFIDIAVGFWVKKNSKPKLGTWIIIVIHGLLLFPSVTFVSGISSAMYFLIIISVIGYISTPKYRIHNLTSCMVYFVALFVLFRMFSPAWKVYPPQAYGTFIISFVLVCISILVLDIAFLEQYALYNEGITHQNKAKTEFLARMSHEIRTPINGIIGMNEMIMRESKDEEITKYASNARSSGKVLLTIVNDILDISKVEAGKMDVVCSEYYLKDIVSELIALTSNSAHNKGLDFKWSIDPNMPSKLYGDEVKLVQICTNLLTNAVKYTDEGTVYFILDGKEGNGKYTLYGRVKDTGRGIDESSKEYIFDAFERLDIDKSKKIEGTGLGLNITKRYLELMGGKIDFDSKLSEGTEFWFELDQEVRDNTPVGVITIKNVNYNENKSYSGKFIASDARILAVDDNKMNLDVLENLLKRTKIKVDKALSGRECIEKAKTEKYDIMFIDHMMPEMDGIETLRILNSQEDNNLNKDTPKIVLTANAISGAKDMYIEKGFDNYITKPIDPDILDRIVCGYIPKDKIVFIDENADEVASGPKENSSSEDKATPHFDVPEIEGFDWEYAGRYNPDTEILLLTLSEFKNCLPDMLDEIKESYSNLSDENSKELLRIKVHALKGICASLGNLALFQLAKYTEFAVRDDDMERVHALMPILTSETEKCMEILSGYEFEAD